MAETIEAKKEEFRKYLEKGGVIDALSKVLVGLYEEPEKPGNALEFLQRHLQGGAPNTADVESLRAENAALKLKNEQLETELEELKKKLAAKAE
eukprot:m.111941 g.111941  ORF g.111941 m.111941 type:complete len:94 (+) comp15961_c0_seq8:1879-2160(+)